MKMKKKLSLICKIRKSGFISRICGKLLAKETWHNIESQTNNSQQLKHIISYIKNHRKVMRRRHLML